MSADQVVGWLTIGVSLMCLGWSLLHAASGGDD